MTITYKEKEYEIKEGQSFYDAFKDEINKSNRRIITCKFNNQIKSLNDKPNKNGKLELLDYTYTEGKRVYVRGIMYIMSMAFHELYPEGLITINYQLDNSMYCTFDNLKVTDEVIKNVKAKMQEIIDEDIAIRKVNMEQKEAEEFYEREKKLRGILQIDSEDKEAISLYYCKDYYNYFYGVMPISTGYIKVFDLVKYYKGLLLRYPNKKSSDKIKPFVENKKLISTFEEYENIYRVLKLNTIYRLNNKIKEDNGRETILLAEALHEKKISNIADKIAKDKKIKMVLIAGPSSSGKTTFAKRLRNSIKTKWDSAQNTICG